MVNDELDFPGGSVVKNLPSNAGDMGLIPELERYPGEGNGNPLQYSCLGKKYHGQRSLTGYGPWGLKRVWHNLATKQQKKDQLILSEKGFFESKKWFV